MIGVFARGRTRKIRFAVGEQVDALAARAGIDVADVV